MKVVVDVGGTKTFIGISEGKEILHHTMLKTPQKMSEFYELFNKINDYSRYSKTLNMAIPGRVDSNGRIILLPNVNLKNYNLAKPFKDNFNSINIQNDVFCGSLNLIYNDGVRNSLLVNWGSGIGGAIIIDGKIYTGNGNAGEVGHISFGKRDIENYIGGLFVKKNYGYSGEELHLMAERGDKIALEKFRKISEKFGYFLRSMVYIFDPDSIYLFGSFLNSWPFMVDTIEKILETYKRDVKIHVINDKHYIIKGCYYLDEYLKNKKV